MVCASANPDKVAELAALLDGVVELEPRPAGLGEVVEDGDTLVANARLKARAVAEAADAPAVADDTGLEVEALDGAPGVFAARYAGEDATYADNVALLLRELERAGALAPDERRARFRTVVLACAPDGREVLAEGSVAGTISVAPRGANGFGYDPVFEPDGGDSKTFAEMTAQAKNALSHRSRAVQAFAELVRSDPSALS